MLRLKLALNRPQKILTPREEEILVKIVEGKRNNEIANELFISIATAKAHVSSILRKFNVLRRSDIIRIALLDNWVVRISENN